MYTFSNLDTTYEFNSCVTFANGDTNTFRKIEHVSAENIGDSYIFTMQGSSEETLDGDEPEGWDAIVLKFGKALYPFSLQVSNEGRLNGFKDFEKIRNQWLERRQSIIDYYNDYYIEKESDRYYFVLKTEEKFFGILQKNMFYRLLFWQDNIDVEDIEIRDFPLNTRLTTFTFNKGRFEDGFMCYTSGIVHDEGSGRLIDGVCKLKISRSPDGLPKEITLSAKVEEQDTGYFTKKLTIKRL